MSQQATVQLPDGTSVEMMSRVLTRNNYKHISTDGFVQIWEKTVQHIGCNFEGQAYELTFDVKVSFFVDEDSTVMNATIESDNSRAFTGDVENILGF